SLLILSSFYSSLFSFYSPADHRALHSFPTRRSSDLACGRSPAGPGAAEPDGFLGDQGHPRSGQGREAAGLAGAEPTAGPGQARRDRKSTRLNSSHLGISYAVFCLKKKKKKTIK